MRWLPPALLIFLLVFRVCAQEQERKLIDRLLKPDLTLQNSAQNKEFAIKSTSGDRQLKTRRFFWQRRANIKTFSDMRSLSTQSFQAGSFESHRKTAARPPFKNVNESGFAFETLAVEVRHAPVREMKIDEHDFTGNHPFLGRGKSQKTLSTLKPPLTIEQVRELLNKNK